MGNFIIALDGPSGSGKSTLAEKLAEKLNIEYLNTGSMYRAVTKYLLEHGFDKNSDIDFNKVLKDIEIKFKNKRIFLNGHDVTDLIRNDIITENVSRVSSKGPVREFLVQSQRDIAKNTSFILDGRDIGTVVFPNAKYKFFITASPKVRAKRRFDQGEINKSLEEIEEDIIKRDYYDSHRDISPLKKADDAILVDNSDMSIDQTVDFIIGKMEREDVI
jgi:cytidylate kinase